MDKKYYSDRHKKYTKNKPAEKSVFLMRLNISLGIAIIAIGIYKLDNDFSKNLSMTYKELVSGDISFSEIKKDFNNISSFGDGISAFSYGDNSIQLDKSVIDYINNIKNTYVDNNASAVSP